MQSDSSVTVTTPAAGYLADIGDIKLLLDLGEDADAALGVLAKQATAAAERFCRRRLRAETVTEKFDVYRHCGSITLDRYPIVGELIGLTISGQAVDLGAVEVDAEAGVLRRLAYAGGSRIMWPCGRYSVSYRAGYEPDAIPDDISAAVAGLVRAAWFSRGRDPSIRRESVPDVLDVSYSTPSTSADDAGLPADVAVLLGPHVRVLS